MQSCFQSEMFLSNSVDMMKNLIQTFHRPWFTFLIYHKSYLQLHSIVDYGDLKGVTKEKVLNVWQLLRIELFVLLLHTTTKYSYLFLIETSIENVSKTFKSMYLKEWVNAVERLSYCCHWGPLSAQKQKWDIIMTEAKHFETNSVFGTRICIFHDQMVKPKLPK